MIRLNKNITKEISAEKRVTKSGRSFVLNVTTELRLMGLGPGDKVGITLRRDDGDQDAE